MLDAAAEGCVVVQLGEGSKRKRRCSGEFELPEDVSEDDEVLLTSVLSALCALDKCVGYSVQHALQNTAFMIRGTLHEDTFEIGLDDLRFIHMANPLRVEYAGVSRCGGNNELLVRVLNSKQRVMLTEHSTFFVCNRSKRKMAKSA
jgi:hypothetical protein